MKRYALFVCVAVLAALFANIAVLVAPMPEVQAKEATPCLLYQKFCPRTNNWAFYCDAQVPPPSITCAPCPWNDCDPL